MIWPRNVVRGNLYCMIIHSQLSCGLSRRFESQIFLFGSPSIAEEVCLCDLLREKRTDVPRPNKYHQQTLYESMQKKIKLPWKVHFQFPWLWTAGSWTGRQWWRRSCRSRRIRRSRWPSARSEQGPELASLPGRTSSCSAAWPAASASGESSSPGGRKWSWLSGSEFQLELVVFRTRQSQSGNHLLHGVIGWIWLNQPSRDTIRTLARLGISSLLPVSHQDP